MLTLLQDPERVAGLRTHLDQVPAALEEHLRYLGLVYIASLRLPPSW